MKQRVKKAVPVRHHRQDHRGAGAGVHRAGLEMARRCRWRWFQKFKLSFKLADK